LTVLLGVIPPARATPLEDGFSSKGEIDFMRLNFDGFERHRKAKMAKDIADLEKWLRRHAPAIEGTPVRRTQLKTGAMDSTPGIHQGSESEAPMARPGPPQPKDFGATPEQIATYRPTDPELGSLSWLVVNLVITTIVIFAVSVGFSRNGLIPPSLEWLAVLLAAAAWFWALVLVVNLLRYIPRGIAWLPKPDSLRLTADIRKRVEMYLHAKAEYEEAVREAGLQRRRQQEEYWRSLSGREFESEMARLYRAVGYAVETTPVTGDEGADLLLRKDGELIVVQCKCQDAPVGPHIVRDLHGTMHHFHASQAFLDAPGGFTEAVRRYAHGKPIELHDLSFIVNLQERLSGKSDLPQTTDWTQQSCS
jgi:hypothetical protein